jgi:DNA-directed RNA polymerase subunit RPC12/RpoP
MAGLAVKFSTPSAPRYQRCPYCGASAKRIFRGEKVATYKCRCGTQISIMVAYRSSIRALRKEAVNDKAQAEDAQDEGEEKKEQGKSRTVKAGSKVLKGRGQQDKNNVY